MIPGRSPVPGGRSSVRGPVLRRIGVAFAVLILGLLSGPAEAEKRDWLDLARRGWSYELRTTMVGRDMSIPVRIHGRALAAADICIVGETPIAGTKEVIDSFRALIGHVFGEVVPMRYAGPDARDCGTGQIVLLRLYSGDPPNRALSDDLDWMSGVYGLGLPSGRLHVATSPAIAQTFFGRRGQATHIMVQQPRRTVSKPIDKAFFRSILIEELFQSFTFGMDVLQFDRKAAFLFQIARDTAQRDEASLGVGGIQARTFALQPLKTLHL